jgi:hypothetical protein
MAKMCGERPPADYEAWDLRSGRVFEREVVWRFGSSIHHPSSSSVGSFFLLAVFRRSSFCLTEKSVGMALHSILGGSPSGFHICCAQPCHFRFSIAPKNVDLLVTSKRRVTTEHFDVYFHLWRNGGPNWWVEFQKWEEEEENQWTLVSRKKKKNPVRRVHFASPIRQSSPIIKSSPSFASNCIKLGDFACPVRLTTTSTGPCSSKNNSLVPVSRVFGSLHRSLDSVNQKPSASPVNSNSNLKSLSSAMPRDDVSLPFDSLCPTKTAVLLGHECQQNSITQARGSNFGSG